MAKTRNTHKKETHTSKNQEKSQMFLVIAYATLAVFVLIIFVIGGVTLFQNYNNNSGSTKIESPSVSQEVALEIPNLDEPQIDPQSGIEADPYFKYATVTCGNLSFKYDDSQYQIGLLFNEQTAITENEDEIAKAFAESTQNPTCNESDPLEKNRVILYPQGQALPCYRCGYYVPPALTVNPLKHYAIQSDNEYEFINLEDSTTQLTSPEKFKVSEESFINQKGVSGTLSKYDFENNVIEGPYTIEYNKVMILEFQANGKTQYMQAYGLDSFEDQVFNSAINTLSIS